MKTFDEWYEKDWPAIGESHSGKAWNRPLLRSMLLAAFEAGRDRPALPPIRNTDMEQLEQATNRVEETILLANHEPLINDWAVIRFALRELRSK